MDYPGKVITKTQVTPTQTSASGNWTLDDQAAAIKNNNWPVALVPNPISKSLRFNSADSAYLNRTPATATNRRTFTWSGWVKRGSFSSTQALFESGNGTGIYTLFWFTSSDQIQLLQDNGSGGVLTVTTNAVFRDPSAWYHIVIAFDTTQATSNNRTIIYVNGTNQSLTYTAQLAQNADTWVNFTYQHRLGARTGGTSYFNGYLTEINFIDGQALTPSDFGLTNPQTGQWIPKKYTGTYGTNGFYLNFKDATSTTTLGYDYSGNANNWTTNNFSVTAGSGNDSLTDVPTPWVAYNTTGDVGGVVRGNYATMNPVASVTTPPTFANGNLEVTGPSSGVGATQSTFGGTGGKFYVEVTVTRASDRLDLGIAGSLTASTFMTSTNYLGTDTNTIGYGTSTGVIRKDNANNQTGLATCTTGDVVGMAIDMDSGTIQFYKNNSTVGTAVSFTPSAYGSFLVAQTTSFNTSKGTYNFGQRPFAYTPPAGFRSLCTTNLPATTIGFGLTNQGDDYFNTVLYTGNGVAIGSGGQTITGVGFQSDFTWIKSRSDAYSHRLIDVVRGAPLELISESTAAETNRTEGLNNWTSDGFVVGNASGYNANTSTFVAWNWKAGGTGVTNTAGTITSTVSANTTAGFSIVTYTGTGTNGATVGHGLGVVPDMIIIKRRNSTGQWATYHRSIGNTGALRLNATSATITDVSFWNNTSPTSTVFTIGVDGDVNTNTGTYVAYCFDAVAGYSAFGSYTGNASTDGPFIYTGFRPRFIFGKDSGGTNNWWIFDSARDTYNVAGKILRPNLSDAELDSPPRVDLLSNGFKIRSVNLPNDATTYIYAAFAESPFQFANAR